MRRQPAATSHEDRTASEAGPADAQIGPTLIGAAIVAALVEARLVDAERVAAFAEIFASAGPGAQPMAAEQLHGFAALVRTVARMPVDTGRT
ncbi:hypothetical protein [Methylobacterium oryzisoli]|uniref:hypothetical protein n=1 Tax=Methylobacterium oryzisoli TaxID=3385502 RepID=UPI0038917AAB